VVRVVATDGRDALTQPAERIITVTAISLVDLKRTCGMKD